jgi:hypothetical protein
MSEQALNTVATAEPVKAAAKGKSRSKKNVAENTTLVGYLYGGLLRSGYVRLVLPTTETPEQVYGRLALTNYGKATVLKYYQVKPEDANAVLETVRSSLTSPEGDLYFAKQPEVQGFFNKSTNSTAKTLPVRVRPPRSTAAGAAGAASGGDTTEAVSDTGGDPVATPAAAAAAAPAAASAPAAAAADEVKVVVSKKKGGKKAAGSDAAVPAPTPAATPAPAAPVEPVVAAAPVAAEPVGKAKSRGGKKVAAGGAATP